MIYNNIFNILTITPSTVQAVTSSTTATGTFDWRPLISSAILVILAAFLQWWFGWRKGASKRDTDHFIAFMDESAEFREEVRQDREKLKDELSNLIVEKEGLKIKIIDLETKYEQCNRTVIEHSKELENCREENVILQEKIKKLKEVLYTLKSDMES